MGIIDGIRKRALDSLSAWANGSNEDISADEMVKALQARGLAEPTQEQPKAMFFDPYAINDWGGWRQRPSMLTYEALRHMSVTCAPLAAIIQLRTNQMAQFARPQQGKYDKGYRVILRDRRDRNKSMSKAEQARAMEIERMLETTGVLQTGERARDRDNFRTFLKKGLRDTLTYDQACHPAGTLVQMAQGDHKAIEDIRPGDVVITHVGRARKVTETYARTYSGNMVRVEYCGQQLVQTEGHPLYVERSPHKGREWAPARDLVEGHFLTAPEMAYPPPFPFVAEQVHQADGYHFLPIDRVEVFTVKGAEVFNLEVEEDHSYLANGICSHNCFEKLQDRKGRVSRFVALPSETIRPAVLDVEHTTPEELRERVSYVQVYENTVIAEFAYDELAWCIMNPRSDLRTNGFGFSPIEQIIRLVTAWLFGFQYNQNFFCIAPGALITTDRGLVPVDDLVGEEFKVWNGRAWVAATGYESGPKPVVRTKLVNGLELRTSQKHLFRVIPLESETGLPEWREQRALKTGDTVLVGYGRTDVAIDYDSLLVGKHYETDRSTGHDFTPTREMVDDVRLWEMIGFALGDGYWPHGRVGKLGIYPNRTKDADLFERFSEVLTAYGINHSIPEQSLSYETKDGKVSVPVIHIQHKAFVHWLYDLGFRTSAEERAIPRLLFKQPAWMREALLRGLFSADGCTKTHVTGYRTPSVASSCAAFRQDILACLWSVGVAADESGRGWDRSAEIRPQDIGAFVERIRYLQAYKNEGIVRDSSTQFRWDVLHPETARSVARTLKQHPNWLTLEQSVRGQISQVLAG